jgi:putative peptidoglycan lipid II flippase
MTVKNKKTPHKLLKNSAIVGTMTLISRILGMFRDVVMANFLGASLFADAFFVAFKIPNFFRRLCAEGAFSQAFIPVLAEYKGKYSFKEVKAMLANVSGTFICALAIITISGILLSPIIIKIFAPGFVNTGEKTNIAIELLRITFPYLFFISIAAFTGAILNSYENFIAPAISPCILNICLILSAIFFTHWFNIPVFSLAWGVFIAGILQMLFQLYYLWKLNLITIPRINYNNEAVTKIIHLTIPALFSVSVSQINLLLDTVLASFLQSGSISWLYYSDRLVELPLGVIGIAISTVILPSLSSNYSNKSKEQFAKTMNWAILLAVMVGLPCSFALFAIAEPLLATIFGYGKMTANDIYMTSLSLKCYSIGLIAFMLIKILSSGYFSRQNTKTPVSIAIKAMIANMILNLILIKPLQHYGLALATAISAWLNVVMLFYGLYRMQVIKITKTDIINFSKLVLATCVMTIIVTSLTPQGTSWLQLSALTRVLNISWLVIVGIISYFSCLLLTRFPFSYFWKT